MGIGGAAVSRAMLERFERQFGAEVVQGWGMTETSPIGVVSKLLPRHEGLDDEALTAVKLKQGRGVWGVDLKLVDDVGEVQPWDGVSRGHLRVRGPWIASGYFKGEGGSPIDEEGFFSTGDVATIDADGYLQLVDRAKDVIKSGGEWISSIDVENAAMGHPAVAEAAAIGIACEAAVDPEHAALAYFEEHLKPKSASSLRHAVKAARLDYVVQKATEMGVSAIQPVITRFTQGKAPAARLVANAIEAAEQCEVLNVPAILPEIALPRLLADWKATQGDRLLVMLSEMIRALLPERALAARLGGDEFVILLGDVTDERVVALGSALREQFHRAAAQAFATPEAVTLSIGASLFDRPPASLAALIEQGDAALYESKRGGRDRIRLVAGGEA